MITFGLGLNFIFQVLRDAESKVKIFPSHDTPMTQVWLDRYATHMPHIVMPHGVAQETLWKR